MRTYDYTQEGYFVHVPLFGTKRRKELAAMCEVGGMPITESRLRHCIAGFRNMDAADALRVEKLTKGAIRREYLTRAALATWPELKKRNAKASETKAPE